MDNCDMPDEIPTPVEIHLTESERRSMEGLSTEQKAVKPASRAAKRCPLRGAPYRYERPYDAVAEHEWTGVGE